MQIGNKPDHGTELVISFINIKCNWIEKLKGQFLVVYPQAG
jgi:hypothetical protein